VEVTAIRKQQAAHRECSFPDGNSMHPGVPPFNGSKVSLDFSARKPYNDSCLAMMKNAEMLVPRGRPAVLVS
jgi:hypothetical protein